MTREELIYKLFGQPQEQKITSSLEEIKEAFSKKTDSLVIDVREIELEDPSRKIKDPTYLEDEYLKITETGIKILHSTPNVANQLKNLIPRTVKELTIPSEFLSDISFLSEFPNLESLTISDYSTFTKEEIEYIEKNTTITNLKIRSSTTFNNIRNKPGFNIIESGNIIGQYGKLTMFYKSYTGKWNSSININASSYNAQDIKILESMYRGIRPHLPRPTSISIKRSDETLGTDVQLMIDEEQVKKITIKNLTPTEASRIYKVVKSISPVKETIYQTPNETQDDFYELKQMSQTSNLTIKYHDELNKTVDASYEEFLNMRATIDYYKELLEQSNLSPVEKVAYVYDILKTMRYRENYQDKLRARNIHAIVTDGNIVCAGYAAFAKQLLNEVGIKALSVSVTCIDEENNHNGHARNFVRVDDDKYNIHGLYAMDITWDSDKDISIIEEDGKKIVVSRADASIKDKMVDKYDSLVLYRHFLVPMVNYEERYPNEINPMIYEEYKKGSAKQLVSETRKISSGKMRKSSSKNLYVLEQHQHLFSNEEGPLTIERYFNEPKPSLETFKKILSNVRRYEGYTKEESEQDVQRVVELHEMLRQQNPNSPNHFFKPSTK